MGLTRRWHSRNVLFSFLGCAEVPEEGRKQSRTGAIRNPPKTLHLFYGCLRIPLQGRAGLDGGGGDVPSVSIPTGWVAVGKALGLTQEQQPSQRGQGTQSWDRAIPGLQQAVIQSSWGWKTAYSGQDSQDFPPCQLLIPPKALEQLIKQALASL